MDPKTQTTCNWRRSQEFSVASECVIVQVMTAIPTEDCVVTPDVCQACLAAGPAPNVVTRDAAVTVAIRAGNTDLVNWLLALTDLPPLQSVAELNPDVDLTCPHRQAVVRQALCDVCGGVLHKGQPFAVFACAKHGECSLQRMRRDVRPCITCQDLPWHVTRTAELVRKQESHHADDHTHTRPAQAG